MDLTNIDTIKKILKKNNLFANKKFGQNFLKNKKILDKIIKTADIQNNDHIIEIGPGLGCLTIELAKYAKKVTTIELDANLIPILQKNLAKVNNHGVENVEILNEDALDFELPGEPYKVVANIPYNITSPLINHFVKDVFMSIESPLSFLRPVLRSITAKDERQESNLTPPTLLTLLVQKEVAEKICGEDKKLNVIALNVQTFADCEIIADVSKNNFHPQPKVDSAIIKITPHKTPKVTCDLKKYFQIISIAFSQKRKKIRNSLGSFFESQNIDSEKIFQEANVNPDSRPEDLTILDFENITMYL